MGNDDTHFVFALQLFKIGDNIASKLYLAPLDQTRAEIQTTLRQCERDVANWQSKLEAESRTKNLDGGFTIKVSRHTRSPLHLCSIRMILYRPFLCEIRISEESKESSDLNRRCADACVRAAIDLVQHLPNGPIPPQVTQTLPWWRLLHYVGQSLAVISLELCLNLQHIEDDTRGAIFPSLRKALSYLQCLRQKAGRRIVHELSFGTSSVGQYSDVDKARRWPTYKRRHYSGQ